MSECKHEKGLGYEGECVHCLKAELETIKEKARAAVNAPYEDILDMGLRQALNELEEALPPQ